MDRTRKLGCSAVWARRARVLAAFCLVALLTAVPAAALDPHVRVTQYHTLSFQNEQGLPQNSVQAILQSHDRYLWLGTQAGLVRFDGVRFVVFDRLSEPEFTRENVRALAEDRDGTLWIATDDGLLSLKEGVFRKLNDPRLPSQLVLSLLMASDGTLWIGTEAGVCRFKDGRLLEPLILPGTKDVKAVRITETRDRSIWLSTGVGLLHVAGARLDRHGIQQGLPDVVYDVREDREGTIWVGTDRGLARLRGDRLERVPLPVDDSVHAIFEDAEGTLWLGFERRGIARLHDGKAELLRHGRGAGRQLRDGLPRGQAGERLGGALRRRAHVPPADPVLGLRRPRRACRPTTSRPILQSASGDMWLGTNSAGPRAALRRSGHDVHDEGWPARRRDHGAGGGAGGRLWVGTPRGLCQIVRGRVTNIPDPGRVLQSGVRSPARAPTARCGSAPTRASAPFAVGTWPVSLRAGDAVSPSHPGDADRQLGRALARRESRPDAREGRSGEDVHHRRRPGGQLRPLPLRGPGRACCGWGRSAAGSSRVKDGIKSVTAREGLFDNAAFAILEDDFGYLWMSSNRGIFKVLKADVNAFAAGTEAGRAIDGLRCVRRPARHRGQRRIAAGRVEDEGRPPVVCGHPGRRHRGHPARRRGRAGRAASSGCSTAARRFSWTNDIVLPPGTGRPDVRVHRTRLPRASGHPVPLPPRPVQPGLGGARRAPHRVLYERAAGDLRVPRVRAQQGRIVERVGRDAVVPHSAALLPGHLVLRAVRRWRCCWPARRSTACASAA